MQTVVRNWTVGVGLALLTHAALPTAQVSTSIGGPPGARQLGGADVAPMPTGTGTILGRAVEAGTNRPVPGAIVTLSVPSAAPVRVMADAQGQFAFRELPIGRFSLIASKAGYVDGAYGRQRPGGQAQSLELTDDQHASDVIVSLWKFGAITGRVVDETGDPIVGTTVRVLKRTIVAGKRQFAMGLTATTDDRGVYRMGSLEPAEYLVVVPMIRGNSPGSLRQMLALTRDLPAPPPPPPGGGGGNAMFVARVNVNGNEVVVSSGDAGVPPAGTSADGRTLTYASEFFPAAPSASRAQPVTVSSGEERAGIDFQLKPVRAVLVSGTVNAPGAQAGTGTTATLISADAEDLLTPIEIASTPVDGSGTFRFVDVPSGPYTLHVQRTPRVAPRGGETVTIQSGGMVRMETQNVLGPGFPTPPLPTEPTLWADVPLNVAGDDITDLAVPLRSGLRVSGRVEFSGSIPPPTPDQMSSISITLEPADGRTGALSTSARGRVESSGQFATMGVAAGKYLLRVGAPGQWALRGAVVNGQDIADVPVELEQNDVSGVVISFTDRSSSISGNVTSSAGQPDSGAAVLLFPSDRAAWTNTGSNPRRLRNIRTANDGSYTFSNVPTGDYFIVAIPDAAAADWPSTDFLATVSRGAARISVQEGEKKTQALTTARSSQ